MINNMMCFIIVVLSFSCSGTGKNVLPEIVYAAKVKEIAVRVKDLTWVNEPLGYEDFKVIYNQPEKYLDSAVRYLNDIPFNEVEFGIVALSMHKLRFGDYLIFVESCVKSYRKKKIEENWLKFLLLGLYANPYVKNHYNNPKVQAILKELIDNPTTGKELLETARELKDGKIQPNWKDRG